MHIDPTSPCIRYCIAYVRSEKNTSNLTKNRKINGTSQKNPGRRKVLAKSKSPLDRVEQARL